MKILLISVSKIGFLDVINYLMDDFDLFSLINSEKNKISANLGLIKGNFNDDKGCIR
ncbi:hypothetical protein HOD75_01730 [archaeon]|jgi:hypothetical protein|nr:hypothetical protein [archaeon]MBT4241597.1 hypothetical protein [archaeon]MBT4417992.1 hypothetical protein [archaeon]